MKQKTLLTATKADSGKPSANRFSRDTLRHIFEELLKDTYWSEKYLTKALAQMVKSAFHKDLKLAFMQHLEETVHQVDRLEKCFALMEKKPGAKKCDAMEGLVKEAQDIIHQHESGYSRDAALISAAQKIEHYEISVYGSLRSMALVLGQKNVANLFDESEEEEVEADSILSELAEVIHPLAASYIEVEA
jgi:ferritin-like metal-binding protein YciE